MSQLKKLEYTQDQQKAIDSFNLFYQSDERFPLFILKGYAGTGKSTLIASISIKNTGDNMISPMPESMISINLLILKYFVVMR